MPRKPCRRSGAIYDRPVGKVKESAPFTVPRSGSISLPASVSAGTALSLPQPDPGLLQGDPVLSERYQSISLREFFAWVVAEEFLYPSFTSEDRSKVLGGAGQIIDRRGE